MRDKGRGGIAERRDWNDRVRVPRGQPDIFVLLSLRGLQREFPGALGQKQAHVDRQQKTELLRQPTQRDWRRQKATGECREGGR